MLYHNSILIKVLFMKNLKTVILSLLIMINPCSLLAQDMSSDEVKFFRNLYFNINKNKFMDLSELKEKAKDDYRYKVMFWHQLANNKSSKTFSDMKDFLIENPHFPKKYLLQDQAERLITDETDKDEIKKFFENNSPRTINGLKYHTLDLPEYEKSLYLKNYWKTADFTANEDKFFYNNFKKYLDISDLQARIDNLLWQGKTKSASELMRYAPKDYQLLYKARIALRRNYSKLTKTIDAVPDSLKNDEGLIYERVRWRRKKNKYTDAIELLNSEFANKTHPKEWWVEKLIIIRKLLDEGKYQNAYDLTIKGNNNSSDILAENSWLAGWISYRFLNRPDIALGHFLTMRESVTSFISKARGDYWIGRCYEAVHDLTRAWDYYNEASQYTTTFYGQKAIERGEIEIDDIFANKPDVEDWQYSEFKETDLAKSIKFLSDLNLKNLMNTFALRTFFEAEKGDEENVVSLVKFMREIKQDEIAVLLTRRARTAGIDVGAYGYPILNEDIEIPKGSDIPLIHAVIRQESAFNPRAKSPAGARGLMQIMPSTARNLSSWKRLRYSIKRLISDVNYNVTLGEYYLGRLLKQHKGSYIKTFAAYNAGAGNVRKWNREFLKHQRKNDLDDIDWIESIKFNETRNYVQRVEENYYIYKKIFENK